MFVFDCLVIAELTMNLVSTKEQLNTVINGVEFQEYETFTIIHVQYFQQCFIKIGIKGVLESSNNFFNDFNFFIEEANIAGMKDGRNKSNRTLLDLVWQRDPSSTNRSNTNACYT